jgi:hypothetical protein
VHAPELSNGLVVRAPAAPATTSVQCSADIPIPAAARSESVADSRTGKVSAGHEDRKPVDRSQPLRRAQIPNSHVQSVDKHINDPAHMIVRHQFLQTHRRQRALPSALSLHVANKKDALAFARASSYLPAILQRTFYRVFAERF